MYLCFSLYPCPELHAPWIGIGHGRRCGDERRADLHGGGPGRERRADRGAVGGHQPLLARRRAAGRLDLRPPRPPPHHRARQRLLPRRPALHGARRRVQRPHGRPLHRRNRRRLRLRDRPHLRRRDLAGLLPRPPHLSPRDFQQHGGDAELRVEPGLLGPAGAPVVAGDVRGGGGAAGVPGGGNADHAGVAAVAGHEGPRRRGESRAPQDLGHGRRGRAPAARDRGRRQHRRRREREQPRRRRVEGGGGEARRPARPGHGPHAAVLPAGFWHRLRGALRPADPRRRRRHHQRLPPQPQRHLRRRQGRLHPHRHGARRPRRPASAAARQHRRHGGVAGAGGHPVRRGGRRRGGVGGERGGGGGIRGVLLHGAGAHGVGVQLGDPAAAAAGPGRRARHGHEPDHVRRGHHDIHLALQGRHHGRRVLHLRRRRRRRVRVRVHVPAGDQGTEPRGHGGALPHKVIGMVCQLPCLRERDAIFSWAGYHLPGRPAASRLDKAKRTRDCKAPEQQTNKQLQSKLVGILLLIIQLQSSGVTA